MLIRALLQVGEEVLRRRLSSALTSLEVLVLEPPNDAPAGSDLGHEAFDLLVTTSDELLASPQESISRVRALPDRPEVIVLSEPNDAGGRARLLAAGAFAVLSPSVSDDELRATLQTLVARHRKTSVDQVIAERAGGVSRLADFSSRSPAMRSLLAIARKVVDADTSLLIQGETGVGKEWLARAIHAEGPRATGPFIAVNPSEVPEQLLESELFGHDKGAFTGASRARRGAFELAHRGTLFLDEVGEMPSHLQVKLLRALQERSVKRLGSERSLEVDVRIMSATNQNLVADVESKRFRQDLYYRLGVMTLTLPPLRERREDILPLVDTYLLQFRAQLGRTDIRGAAPEVKAALEAYSWPGNVRELINVVERSVLLCEEDRITLDDLPEELSSDLGGGHGAASLWQGPKGADWNSLPLADARAAVLDEFERQYLDRLLRATGGRVGEAARRAGIDRRTLYSKMRLLGLEKGSYKTPRLPETG